MAQSAVGKLQAKRLLEVVVKAKVTCSCFYPASRAAA